MSKVVIVKLTAAGNRTGPFTVLDNLGDVLGIDISKDITGENWQDTIKDKKGIVFFHNYWLRPGQTKNPTGDHIDLWNGSRLTASGFEGAVVTILRFDLGINSGPGFSDLRKATTILFWEVR